MCDYNYNMVTREKQQKTGLLSRFSAVFDGILCDYKTRFRLVRHWIKKITVHPDRLTIEFKTGDIVETGGDNE